jgi:hypothetical protein
MDDRRQQELDRLHNRLESGTTNPPREARDDPELRRVYDNEDLLSERYNRECSRAGVYTSDRRR